jgi:DNA polymerase-3 subunit alpha (Gram-positive type)
MFPKAHATAYVMMAYRIAYFKVHHPKAFYASYFTVRADDFDVEIIDGGKNLIKEKLSILEQKSNTITTKEKSLQTILEMAYEMYLRGFTFEKMDLYKSDAVKFLITDTGLLPPFVSLAGLGRGAAFYLARVRNERPFSSVDDLRLRAKVSKPVIELLKTMNCLDGLDDTDQICLFS